MGLIYNKSTPYVDTYGNILPNPYINVKQVNGNAKQKTQLIVLEMYSSKDVSTGSRPIDSYSYTVNGDDWDTFFAPTSINPVDTNQYSQAYSYIMQLEENIGTKEEPEKVLVWRDWETDQV